MKDRLQILSKYQLYLWPASSLLIGLMLTIFIIIPSIQHFIKTNQSISESKQKISQLDDKVSQLGKINLSAFQDNENLINQSLPADKDVIGAIFQLQFLASINKIILSGISYSTVSSGGAESSDFQLKTDIIGSLDSIEKFISALKVSGRVMNMTSLDLAGSKDASKLTASMVISVYYQPLPNISSNTDSPVQQLTQAEINLLNTIKSNSQSSSSAFNNLTSNKGKADPFQ